VEPRDNDRSRHHQGLPALPVSARERGERFERLMVQYLRQDPIYAKRYSDVWLWSDWPGRDGKGDTGINLVARERDGDGYCASSGARAGPT
jgi:predicted helicase